MGRFFDLVDDAEVPATSGAHAFKITHERFADTMRILGQGSEHQRDRNVSDFFGEPVEMPPSLRSQLDLIRHAALLGKNGRESNPFAISGLLARQLERGHQFRIASDVQGLLEGIEVVRADQHERWPSISRHEYPFVLTLDTLR